MSLIGRNYYNPLRGSIIKKHGLVECYLKVNIFKLLNYYTIFVIMIIHSLNRLEIWPGFSTSINIFEKNIMLQTDISHKILRCDTVLSNIYVIIQRNRSGFKQEVAKRIIGQIVLTRFSRYISRLEIYHSLIY